nr:short-chain dehydrogenase [Actinomycetota bacterium]
QIQGMPVNGRPDNLYEPVPEEAATHGMFDSRAQARSYQLWANMHRPLVAAAVAGAAAAAAGLVRMSR